MSVRSVKEESKGRAKMVSENPHPGATDYWIRIK
jgi:hypothetical protein